MRNTSSAPLFSSVTSSQTSSPIRVTVASPDSPTRAIAGDQPVVGQVSPRILLGYDEVVVGQDQRQGGRAFAAEGAHARRPDVRPVDQRLNLFVGQQQPVGNEVLELVRQVDQALQAAAALRRRQVGVR